MTLHLQINDDVVDTVTCTQLNSGSFYPLIYNWTPLLEGKYNITVYTHTVNGEVLTANNFKTIIIPVIQKIAFISDIGQLDSLRSIWANGINMTVSTIILMILHPKSHITEPL